MDIGTILFIVIPVSIVSILFCFAVFCFALCGIIGVCIYCKYARRKKEEILMRDPSYVAVIEVEGKRKKGTLDDFASLPTILEVELKEYDREKVKKFKDEIEKTNNYEIHLIEVLPKKEERLLKLFKFESSKEGDLFIKEFEEFSQSCHKNTMLYLGSYTHNTDAGIVCMRYKNGSLHDFYEKRNKDGSLITLPFSFKTRVLSEVCDALEFFHEKKKKIVKTLSPKLVYLTDEMHVKLDYGFTQRFYQEDDYMLSPYTAPELIKPEILSELDDLEGIAEKADVFSFGILMFVVMTENLDVFPHTENAKERQYGRRVAEDALFRPEISDKMIERLKIPIWYVDLMKTCWWEPPQDRPTIAHIKEVIYENTRKEEDEIAKKKAEERKKKEAEKERKNAERRKRKEEEKARKEEEKQKKILEKKRKKEEAAKRKAEEKRRKELEKIRKEEEAQKKKEEEMKRRRESTAMLGIVDKRVMKIRQKNIKRIEKAKGKGAARICVVGDGAVGKTCLLHVYTTGKFTAEYLPTVFENYRKTEKCKIGSSAKKFEFDLSLMDTAGQEDYAELRKLSYENVDVFVLCYNVVMKDTLQNIGDWVNDLSEYCVYDQILLVGLQIDLREDSTMISEGKVIPKEEGEKKAKDLKLAGYMECSSKEGIGVRDVFVKAIDLSLNVEKKKKK